MWHRYILEAKWAESCTKTVHEVCAYEKNTNIVFACKLMHPSLKTCGTAEPPPLTSSSCKYLFSPFLSRALDDPGKSIRILLSFRKTAPCRLFFRR